MKNLFSILFLLYCVSVFSQTVDLPDLNTVDSVRLIKRTVIQNGIPTRKIQFAYIAYKATGDTLNAFSPLYDSVAVVSALQSRLQGSYESVVSAVKAKYDALYGTSEKGNIVYAKMFSSLAKISYPDSTFNSNLTPFLGRWQCTSLNARWADHVGVVTATIKNNANNFNSETGTPAFNGQFKVLSPNCIEITSYFSGYATMRGTPRNKLRTVRFYQMPLGIWISYDFSIALQKL